MSEVLYVFIIFKKVFNFINSNYFSNELKIQRPSSKYKSTGSLYISSGSGNGKPLDEGPRGGISYVNDNGNRTYVPRDAPRHSGTLTGGTHISSGSANGSALYTGPRGGTYYVNSSGNRCYT